MREDREKAKNGEHATISTSIVATVLDERGLQGGACALLAEFYSIFRALATLRRSFDPISPREQRRRFQAFAACGK